MDDGHFGIAGIPFCIERNAAVCPPAWKGISYHGIPFGLADGMIFVSRLASLAIGGVWSSDGYRPKFTENARSDNGA
jgi:hypothetical protein